jgi:formylglycine-generating enzyme required for sulfatase activity
VYDLVAGQEARRRPTASGNALTGRIRPRGICCFVAGTPAALGGGFRRFLQAQRRLESRARWDTAFPEITARLTGRPPAPKAPAPAADMAAIPGASRTLRVQFRSRECGYYEPTDPKRPSPRLHQPIWFERPAVLGPYAMDLTLVTNAQFAAFLRASGYRPRHQENCLTHWTNHQPPPHQRDHPVVYVDLEDARAYATWAGKRLPTEEEWQYAAQGDDGRKYPWGNEMLDGRCNDGRAGGTTPVTAFPAGRSPFGLYDMCGNVWQWTDSERSDGRTRFAILRGGSFYQRGGSAWYFDEGPKPVWFAAKMLLLWPGLDRCATIGFRCAAG